jgi:YHS domain-containing protein
MLTTILWFVIIGALFFFLMRMGGCGGHGHGTHTTGEHGRDTGQHAPGAWTVRDPVCGAEGPAGQAVATAEHEGKVYHFCSQQCREVFLRDPQRYASNTAAPQSGGHNGC